MKRKSSDQVATLLRQSILSGEIPAGSVFPARGELISRIGSTSATVQRAMDLLCDEGFVYTRGTRGTYVTPYLPSDYHVVMAFQDSQPQHSGNRFYRMLVQQAARFDGSEAEPRRISMYYDVNPQKAASGYSTLESMVVSRSIAGVIIPGDPNSVGLAELPISTYPGLPRVALSKPAQRAGVLDTWGHVSFGSIVPKALAHLAAQGCKRVAVISNHAPPDAFGAQLQREIQSHGIRTQPYWILSADLAHPGSARAISHLLFHEGQAERPDGLLIANDSLTEDTLAGVIASGIRVPDELQIVTHGNFPWTITSPVPMARVGYSADEILELCLEELDAQRQGTPPSHREVSARLEVDSSVR